MRIHQWVPAAHRGDAIGDSARVFRDKLRARGHDSEIFALSIDLIWGFTGILSLGQAVYFGIGAYFVALSMKLNYTLVNATRYGHNIPDFMEWNGLTEVPRFMVPLTSTPFAVACALAVATLSRYR